MSFEFHPDQWLDLLTHYPVIIVLFGGQIGAVSFTQVVKKTYLDWGRLDIPEGHYKVYVRLLACISAFVLTNLLWILVIARHNTGLHWVVAFIAGVTSPWLYTGAKAAVAWKFPDFARRWGDGSKDDVSDP